MRAARSNVKAGPALGVVLLAFALAAGIRMFRGAIPTQAQSPLPPSPASVAAWEPLYTSYLALPGDDLVMSLAPEPGGGLWLAGDSWVSRFADGVWSAPETPPGADLILALAADRDRVWAFGIDGAAWRRHAGAWSVVPAPVTADMYAAAVRAPGEVWAVGFDYGAGRGTLFHAFEREGRPAIESPDLPWLDAVDLYAIAAEPGGRLWAGGCGPAGAEGERAPFLMRLDPGEAWQAVPAPGDRGCLRHLAFGAGGAGLAAAGQDLWRWDAAGELWVAFGQAPPEGTEWLRVAALEAPALDVAGPLPGPPSLSRSLPQHLREGLGPSHTKAVPNRTAPPPPSVLGEGAGGWGPPGPSPATQNATASTDAPGWALAGPPDWHGGREGQALWRYDGAVWAPAAVDYMAFQDAVAPEVGSARPVFHDLAGDGRQAWSLNPVEGLSSIDRRAFLVAMGAEEARLAHPWLLLGGGLQAEGDLAAGRAGLWAVAHQGGAPFLRHGGSWAIGNRAVTSADPRRVFSQLDFAPDGRGWALGTERTAQPGGASGRIAWRWDGQAWLPAPAPPAGGQAPLLRALGGGEAWSLRRGPAGGELLAFQDGAWQRLPEAPLVRPAPTPAPGEPSHHANLRAPFDAVGEGDARVGWLAAGPGQLYRYGQGHFAAEAAAGRGQILDLQLTGARSGWAIALDPERASTRPVPTRPAGGTAARPTSGVLLRLSEGAWREVELDPMALFGGDRALAQRMQDIRWLLMAAVGPDEVWLHGRATVNLRPIHLLLGILRGREPVLLGCSGPILALSAFPAANANGSAGGTDVWLLGAATCGPFPGQLADRGDAAVDGLGPERAAVVSRVRVRPVAGRVFLPSLPQGPPPEQH